jgi:hypothetical protein
MTPLEEQLAHTTEFARRHYGDRPSIYGRSLFAHCQAVSRFAEHIAQKLYQDVRAEYTSAETNETLAAIVQGAMLHDVINVSCAFEDVAGHTTVQVAAMVADLSRDYRLVETKRDMEFRGRLSQSPVSTQIVAVADIVCSTKEIIAMLNAEGLPAVPRAKKLLAQLDGDLLSVHAANLYYVLRMYVHAGRNMMREASQLIKDVRIKARTAQSNAVLRAKIAAKLNAKPEKEVPEKKHGKKRTTRRDS